MNLSKNFIYDTSKAILVSSIFTVSTVASVHSSYQTNYYSYESLSTIQDSHLQLDNKYMINKEIEKLKLLIKDRLNLDIENSWYTEAEFPQKTCLFVKCNLSENEKNDFEILSQIEYNMYKVLEDELKESQYFDMIALL